MKVQLRGGKTAPRLLQDLVSYDPRRLPLTGFNILSELPAPFEDGKTPPARIARGSCHHGWVLKDEQCLLPDTWNSRDPTTQYVVAAYCTVCRSHLEVSIGFHLIPHGFSPCPNQTWPLHHFVHLPEISTQTQKASNGSYSKVGTDWVDTQHFECSTPSCSAKLSVRIRPCRLIPQWIELLTDPQRIKMRTEKAISEAPDRFEGIAMPTPIDVLSNLRAYIANAMKSDEVKRILGRNKKWRLCLGESCAELLEYLGFTRDGEDWRPPQPEPAASTPFTNPVNVLLNDVEKELLVLLSKRLDDERGGSKLGYAPLAAMPVLKAALGCLEYQTTPSSRTTDLSVEEHPFYAGLGATADLHDQLIIFAYQRQVEVDPANVPYYLECLQGLGEGRKSEDLQTQVAIEASSGKISLNDIRKAYKDLGLDYNSTLLDDDTVIGTFQARVVDAPRQEQDLRRALHIIGRSRSSEKIKFIASKGKFQYQYLPPIDANRITVVTNYEQALLWLGAAEDINDEFLVSMFMVKVDEKQADEPIARQAMSLIAEHRNSDALRKWLNTGELGESEMDVGYAYNRLGIGDRTIDDDTILAAYNSFAVDTPSQLDDLKKALTAIAKSKDSKLLQGFLNTGMVSSEHPLAEWPVGLENIGNTCYLNSLLQFYFTVQPLRDLVLDFEKYKMSIDAVTLARKRVGSRNVSLKEIQRAQRFVYELQKLFKSMITAPKAQVTPEQELARLTLISSTNEESFRRMSVLSTHRPSLGEINGRPVVGPLPPPRSLPNQEDTEMSGNSALEPIDVDKSAEAVEDANQVTVIDTIERDDSSEDTLVEDPFAAESNTVMTDAAGKSAKEQQQLILEDKENLAPSKISSERASTPENPLIPLGDTSPSRMNEQPRPLSPIKELNQDQGETATATNAGPPNRPPPFPPRPKPDDQKVIQEEINIGAQQDVTEVIANVLFQLQCAITADQVDETGEQLDRIKKLFFGKQKSYTTDIKGVIRTKEEFISDIKVDVASGPRDIYAALDGAFDIQEVEVGGAYEPQYTTLSQIPPILQVLVQRVQFDHQEKKPYKSNHHLELRETIYMDRYVDSADPDLMQRRRECWSWKMRLAEYEKRKLELTTAQLGISLPELLTSTTGYLEQLTSDDVATTSTETDLVKVSSTLIENLKTAGEEVKKEVESIELEIKNLMASINSQFNDLRNIPYRLQSVFIHRGYVHSGHYWIYIRDFEANVWRKYNDGYVTEVKDTKEIFEQEISDRPATSYFVAYVKDSLKDQLVNPVCRDIVEQPPESQDTVMEDALVGHNTEEPGVADPGELPNNTDTSNQTSSDQGSQFKSETIVNKVSEVNTGYLRWDDRSASSERSW